jgi:hypothetical protein
LIEGVADDDELKLALNDDGDEEAKGLALNEDLDAGGGIAN